MRRAWLVAWCLFGVTGCELITRPNSIVLVPADAMDVAIGDDTLDVAVPEDAAVEIATADAPDAVATTDTPDVPVPPDVTDTDTDMERICPSGMCNGACVLLASDVSNCGACGRTCATAANASAECSEGFCDLLCNPGFGDCDEQVETGCETDLTTPEHCGHCSQSCTGDYGVCASGECCRAADAACATSERAVTASGARFCCPRI